MIEIAIVEDEYSEAEQLEKLLREYGRERSRDFGITRFDDPTMFLRAFGTGEHVSDDTQCDEKTIKSEKVQNGDKPQNSDKPQKSGKEIKGKRFDLVFLDICMPGMTGMDVAKKLRTFDSAVTIVFVTNMIQYAVEGYSVQASDFIVKPASAASVNRVMNRALAVFDKKTDKAITVKDSTDGRLVVVNVGDILYVECSGHRITWHTTGGNYADWGSMNAVVSKLPQKSFARCHVSFLVNLKHVRETKKDSVTVGDDVLPVSRAQKNVFFAELAAYLGSGA